MACNNCGQWFHAHCQSINTRCYKNLEELGEEVPWFCAITMWEPQQQNCLRPSQPGTQFRVLSARATRRLHNTNRAAHGQTPTQLHPYPGQPARSMEEKTIETHQHQLPLCCREKTRDKQPDRQYKTRCHRRYTNLARPKYKEQHNTTRQL